MLWLQLFIVIWAWSSLFQDKGVCLETKALSANPVFVKKEDIEKHFGKKTVINELKYDVLI